MVLIVEDGIGFSEVDSLVLLFMFDIFLFDNVIFMMVIDVQKEVWFWEVI